MTPRVKTNMLLAALLMQIEYISTIDKEFMPIKRQKITNFQYGFKTIPNSVLIEEPIKRTGNKHSLKRSESVPVLKPTEDMMMAKEAHEKSAQYKALKRYTDLSMKDYSEAIQTNPQIITAIKRAQLTLQTQDPFIFITNSFARYDLSYWHKNTARILDLCNPNADISASTVPGSARSLYKLLIEPITFIIDRKKPISRMGSLERSAKAFTKKFNTYVHSKYRALTTITLNDVSNLLYIPFLAENYRTEHILYLKLFENHYNPLIEISYVKEAERSIEKFEFYIKSYNDDPSNSNKFETNVISGLRAKLHGISEQYKYNEMKNTDQNKDEGTPRCKLDINKMDNSDEWSVIYQPGFVIPFNNAMANKSSAKELFNSTSDFLKLFLDEVYGSLQTEVIEQILKALALNNAEIKNYYSARLSASTKVMRGLTLFVKYLKRIIQLTEAKISLNKDSEDWKLLLVIKDFLKHLIYQTQEGFYFIDSITEHFNKSVGLLEFFKYIQNQEKGSKDDMEIETEILVDNRENLNNEDQPLEFEEYTIEPEDCEETKCDISRKEKIDKGIAKKKAIKMKMVAYMKHLEIRNPTTIDTGYKIQLFYKNIQKMMGLRIHSMDSLPDGTIIEW